MKLIFLSAIAVATVSAISDLAEIRLAELLSGENDYVPGSNYKVDGPANNFNPAFLKNYNYGYTSPYANTLPTAYASHASFNNDYVYERDAAKGLAALGAYGHLNPVVSRRSADSTDFTLGYAGTPVYRYRSGYAGAPPTAFNYGY
jgi:hypothetical protein